MLHPVGPMPAAVYWRRRLLVLLLLAAVLGGGGWVLAAVLGGSGGAAGRPAPAAATSTTAPARSAAAAGGAPAPALERVVPDLAGVSLPTAAAPAAVGTSAPAPAGPTPGGPCGDDALGVAVRSDVPSAPAGSRPTFTLVVTNTSPVPCVRVLDGQLRELVLVDPSGRRIWGSNDCQAPGAPETRTLAPGESASFPVQWSGRTSSPGCTVARSTAPAGSYVLRGRLDTKTSADVALTLT